MIRDLYVFLRTGWNNILYYFFNCIFTVKLSKYFILLWILELKNIFHDTTTAKVYRFEYGRLLIPSGDKSTHKIVHFPVYKQSSFFKYLLRKCSFPQFSCVFVVSLRLGKPDVYASRKSLYSMKKSKQTPTKIFVLFVLYG